MVLKISKWLGAICSIIAAGWFLFLHFDSSADTEQRSKDTAEIVEELKEIHLKQQSADEAKKAQLTEWCLSGKVKDQSECAKVGIKLNE